AAGRKATMGMATTPGVGRPADYRRPRTAKQGAAGPPRGPTAQPGGAETPPSGSAPAGPQTRHGFPIFPREPPRPAVDLRSAAGRNLEEETGRAAVQPGRRRVAPAPAPDGWALPTGRAALAARGRPSRAGPASRRARRRETRRALPG